MPKYKIKEKDAQGVKDWMYREWVKHAHGILNSYLDEKGVDYRIHVEQVTLGGSLRPRPNYYTTQTANLILFFVPSRLYHEVVVPGLIRVCKDYRIRLRAEEYTRTEGERSLWAKVRVAPEDMSILDLVAWAGSRVD